VRARARLAQRYFECLAATTCSCPSACRARQPRAQLNMFTVLLPLQRCAARARRSWTRCTRKASAPASPTKRSPHHALPQQGFREGMFRSRSASARDGHAAPLSRDARDRRRARVRKHAARDAAQGRLTWPRPSSRSSFPSTTRKRSCPRCSRGCIRRWTRSGDLRGHFRQRRQRRPVAALLRNSSRFARCDPRDPVQRQLRPASRHRGRVRGKSRRARGHPRRGSADPPEEIAKLLAKMDEGYDYVGTVRLERQTRRSGARVAIMNASRGITRIRMTIRVHAARVQPRHRRRDQQLPRSQTFIPLSPIRLRSADEIEVAHEERAAGDSKYSLTASSGSTSISSPVLVMPCTVLAFGNRDSSVVPDVRDFPGNPRVVVGPRRKACSRFSASHSSSSNHLVRHRLLAVRGPHLRAGAAEAALLVQAVLERKDAFRNRRTASIVTG